MVFTDPYLFKLNKRIENLESRVFEHLNKRAKSIDEVDIEYHETVIMNTRAEIQLARELIEVYISKLINSPHIN